MQVLPTAISVNLPSDPSLSYCFGPTINRIASQQHHESRYEDIHSLELKLQPVQLPPQLAGEHRPRQRHCIRARQKQALIHTWLSASGALHGLRESPSSATTCPAQRGHFSGACPSTTYSSICPATLISFQILQLWMVRRKLNLNSRKMCNLQWSDHQSLQHSSGATARMQAF